MLDSDAGQATWLSTRSLSAADADQRWVSGRGRGKSHWLFAPCLRIDSSANQDRKSFIIRPEREGGDRRQVKQGEQEFPSPFCRHHCCSSSSLSMRDDDASGRGGR